MKDPIKTILAWSFFLIMNATSVAQSPVRQGPRPIQPGTCGVGRQIPDLTFTGIDGAEHRLSDFADQKAVVFAMTGTGCPLCLKYSPSLAAIEQQYRNRNVKFIFLNPNESESVERVRNAVNIHGFQGPYVHDGQMILPKILGAETTTEVFLLDQARTLIYRGAVDDQYGFGYALETPQKRFLIDALDAVLHGNTPETCATTSPGCELFYDRTIRTETAVTYHNRISRIMQANCIECHRDGGIAPIPLETYAEVKDFAGMIRQVIQRGIMPPWFAAPQPKKEETPSNSLHWSNERSLSAWEKNDIDAWLNAGAPEGDPDDAPLPKSFPDGWLIGKPDIVFQFPEPLPVKATGTMPYRYVSVETNLPENKWVQAIEIRPGKTDVVHHVIVSVESERERSRGRNDLWAGYAPGNSTYVYPKGYARLLPAGATLRFQMHYTPNGTATEDNTRLGLIFADEPPEHEVRMMGIANPRLRIPPGADNHQEVATMRLPYDIELLGFLPHMHLRGKAARYDALEVGGEELLLDVPHYDFNWQLFYRLAEPKILRRGDSIRFTGWFDNSENNPANPDPNKTVRWGSQTENEMHLGYVEYVVRAAEPGQPIAGNPSTRPSTDSGNPLRETMLNLGGQVIDVATLVKKLRELDQNRDGKLEPAEVPTKHRQVFKLLDANRDDILTTDEVRAAIRRLEIREKRAGQQQDK